MPSVAIASTVVAMSSLPMFGRDVRPSPAFEDGMNGNQSSVIENANDVGQLMHFDDAPRTIGDTVIVAADRHEAIVADATLQLEHGIEWRVRQPLKLWLLDSAFPTSSQQWKP